jgi:nitrous oxide reductase accessory protein NosL
MIRGTLLLVAVSLFLALTTLAAFADSDIDHHRNCKQCGMDRKAYGFSRMLVEFKDGVQVGTCSLHCVVTELNGTKSGVVSSFKVADRSTRQLIDAEKAFWVIGGKKRGVMTQRAKWAFATQESAQAFIIENGGVPATWNGALAAAREDEQPKPR